MNSYWKTHWRFYVGIFIMIIFILIRLLLVIFNGPHDHNIELMSTLSMMLGFLSAYFIFTGLEVIDKDNKEK